MDTEKGLQKAKLVLSLIHILIIEANICVDIKGCAITSLLKSITYILNLDIFRFDYALQVIPN